ncbi:MAG: SGNH/GDSL hydrolase family protein [Lentisphaeria bacterium]|nr:SGNH/GDSL hydrolase family protein [Lentisphaeria bacterium]
MKRSVLLVVLSAAVLLGAAEIRTDSFLKHALGWDTRPYWGGEVTRENGLIVIKSTDFKNRGEFWGRAIGWPLNKKVVLADKHFRITVMVKGKGDVETGFLLAIPKAAGKMSYDYVRSEPVKLSEEFQPVSFEIDLTGVAPKDMTPMVEVKGKNAVVYLQRVVIEEIAGGGAIAAKPLYAVDFTKGRPMGWDTRPYWGGEVKIDDRTLLIKSTDFKNRGEFWGRAMGVGLDKNAVAAGKSFKMMVMVKGQGEFVAGFLISSKKENGKWDYKYVKMDTPVQLTGSCQPVYYTVDISGMTPQAVTPFVQVIGENSFARLREVKVWQVASGGVKAAEFKKARPVPAKSAVEKAAAPKDRIIRKTVASVNFKKGLRSWDTRSYWGGEVSKSGDDLLLKATNFKNKGKFWGRVLGTPPRRVDVTGKRFTVTFKAKGQGEFYPGVLLYVKNEAGKVDNNYSTVKTPFILTGEYKSYSYSVDLSAQAPVAMIPYLEIRGENSWVSVRSCQVEMLTGANAQMELVTPFAVFPQGAAVPDREFKFSQKDVAVQTLQFPVGKQEKAVIQPEISGENGVVKVPVQSNADGLIKFVAAADGATATGFISGVEQSVYDRLDAIAKQIRTDRPVSILYIADSLADFDRGFNAVDHLEFFLNKYNPGKFTISNYAVAGDYILRVEERLTGKRTSDKQRYNGIFDRKYDLVIIALGNNDTHARSTDNYETPLVPVAGIKGSFERVIGIIRKHSPAPVWLLSASKSDIDAMTKKSDLATSKGRLGIRFGVVKHAVNFNAEVKKVVASGENMRYIDIFTPMTQEFDPANYLDGVHLSLKGHQLFAELLLKAFVK